RPGPGETQNHEWHTWLQADLLVREADALVGAVPAQVAQAGRSVEQELARRERKARADHLATQAALAQIRLGIGQKKDAESEVRALLAERQKLASEEPDNPDYQADLAAAHQHLGELLLSEGHIEKSILETKQARALLQKLAVRNLTAARLQVTAKTL